MLVRQMGVWKRHMCGGCVRKKCLWARTTSEEQETTQVGDRKHGEQNSGDVDMEELTNDRRHSDSRRLHQLLPQRSI